MVIKDILDLPIELIISIVFIGIFCVIIPSFITATMPNISDMAEQAADQSTNVVAKELYTIIGQENFIEIMFIALFIFTVLFAFILNIIIVKSKFGL